MEFSNYCVFCKADLGSQNPRQLCYKTYCPFEDEYFEIYNSKSKEFKEKLSKPFIEENLGMFREKGCTTVDRVIQECDSYDEAINKFEHIFIVEENSECGGLGSAVLEFAAKNKVLNKSSIVNIAIPDNFIEQGTISELYGIIGLNAKSISDKVISELPCLKNQNQEASSVE